jgi:hypothetical protein
MAAVLSLCTLIAPVLDAGAGVGVTVADHSQAEPEIDTAAAEHNVAAPGRHSGSVKLNPSDRRGRLHRDQAPHRPKRKDTLSVKLYKNTDDPLEGLNCEVYDESGAYTGVSGTTDSLGEVHFHLRAGQYKIRADYLGYQFWSELYDVSAGIAHRFYIPHQDIRVTVNEVYSGPTPLENVKVHLFSAQGAGLGLQQTTDADGRAVFSLPQKEFKVRADHRGYAFWSPIFSSGPVAVNIPAAKAELTLKGAGRPLEGVRAYVHTGAGGYQDLYGISDNQGRITFQLPAETYKFRADYQGSEFWSDPIALAAGRPNRITIDTGGGIFGLRVEKDGYHPLSDLKCDVYTGAGRYLDIFGTTDVQGRVNFTLADGQYKFKLKYLGHNFWTPLQTVPDQMDHTLTIDHRRHPVLVQGINPGPAPLKGLNAYLYTDAGAYVNLSGITNADGMAAFDLPERPYKAKVEHGSQDHWTGPLRPGGNMVTINLNGTPVLPAVRNFRAILVDGAPPKAKVKHGSQNHGSGSNLPVASDPGATLADGAAPFDLPDKPAKAKVKHGSRNQLNRTPMPPPERDPGATLNAAARIELSWTPLAGAKGIIGPVGAKGIAPAGAKGFPPAGGKGIALAGYALYRRHVCAPAFVRLNTELLPPATAAFTDVDAAGHGTYTYYIAAVSADGVQGLASAIVSAGDGGGPLADNTAEVTNLAAAWDQGVAGVTWDAPAGLQFQIYRGGASDAMIPWKRVQASPFHDDLADPYRTWYYQVATVETVCDPLSGQPTDRIGPVSEPVILAGLTAPTVAGDTMQLNADGNYVITTGASGGYTAQGSYSGFNGDVIITATLGDQTITGTGSNGKFSIDLPFAGDWQITITEANGWQSAVINTVWEIDDQPPAMTIDGATTRSTDQSMIRITGLVSDARSALQGVSISSDRYSGVTFGTTINAMGVFSGEAALKVGENILTVSAADIHGNIRSAAITVTQTLNALPVVQITSPADGASVNVNSVSVSGTVRSSLPPEQIRLTIADQLIFPTGADNAYTFTFENIGLVLGSNVLEVRAETIYGNVTAQSTVIYADAQETTTGQLPQIEILAPLPNSHLAEDPVVTGLVTGDAPITAVTVNGQSADTTGLGSPYLSFKAAVPFSGAQDNLQITVSAVDSQNQSNSLEMTVYSDTEPPVIALQETALQPPPVVNTVTETPYRVVGAITEPNISGAAVNDQSIALVPGTETDTYTFDVGLPLTYSQQEHIVLSAWDIAGNRTSTEWIVSLDSNLVLEVISPGDGVELQGEGATLDVAVTVRVAGAAADDIFKAAVDGASPITLTRTGAVGNTTATVSLDQDDHLLDLSVENASGTLLTRTRTTFTTCDMTDVPIAVERQTPANGATGVEPNDFIALYFNKAIDPALLQIEVLETVHGRSYASFAPGADITQLNKIELVDVNRDRESVPGGIGHFPGSRMAAFYPRRDIAYGANVFVNVQYNGQELLRTTYKVRPLPTFVEGTVMTTRKEALPGIQVAIPDLNLVGTTDNDGGFGLGFKLSADQAIPGGRYRIVANPGLQNPAFGAIERWVTIEEGRLNGMESILLPSLNPNIAYRRIRSGQSGNTLAAGALVLDLTNTVLTFDDLRDQGDVHVQLLPVGQISHKVMPEFRPHWLFAVQPGGIEVSGDMGLQISLPMQNGTYSYIEGRGTHFVLLGLDPRTLMVVPVGAAKLDVNTKTLHSVASVQMERLDYIGFALTPRSVHPYIEQYAAGEIGLDQMIGLIAAGE